MTGLAGHADPRTTRLYDRRQRLVTRNIVERLNGEYIMDSLFDEIRPALTNIRHNRSQPGSQVFRGIAFQPIDASLAADKHRTARHAHAKRLAH